jgi:NAD(P)-dependent dehydrogenase (short-subunit alcohol dehydrogenase family)
MMRSLEEGMNPGGAEAVKQGFEQQIPWKRYARPEDIAHLVVFLLSDESEYCNGSTFVVDGGFQAST